MTNDRQARAARAEQMRKDREKAERKQRSIIATTIVAIVVVLIVVAGWGIKSISDKQKEAQGNLVTDVIEPRNIVDSGVPYVPANGTTAAENAPLVEIYEDFLCPACGQFETMSGAALRQMADEGTIQLRFMPFSFLHTMSTNEFSRRSMNLAMCAVDEQGPEAFWKIHTAIFDNQPAEGGAGPNDAELLQIASAAGVTGLDTCVTTQKFVPWIDQTKDTLSEERQISGTPSVHINGKDTQARTPAELQQAIADATK